MMGHALCVGPYVMTLIPAIAADDPEGLQRVGIGAAGQSCLSCGVPLEDAVGRDLAVEDLRQGGHLQVGIVGNEAALVAVAAFLRGEGHHVAALQAEGAYAVVQLLVGKGHHVAAGVLQSEVAALLALEVLFTIDGEGLVGGGVGEDDTAVGAVEAHLTVHVVAGHGSIDFHT